MRCLKHNMDTKNGDHEWGEQKQPQIYQPVCVLVVYNQQSLASILVVSRLGGRWWWWKKSLSKVGTGWIFRRWTRSTRTLALFEVEGSDVRRFFIFAGFSLEVTRRKSASEIVHPRPEGISKVWEGNFGCWNGSNALCGNTRKQVLKVGDEIGWVRRINGGSVADVRFLKTTGNL